MPGQLRPAGHMEDADENDLRVALEHTIIERTIIEWTVIESLFGCLNRYLYSYLN